MVGSVSDGELADCASVSVSGSVCVLARVFDLASSLDSESEIISVSSQTSQLICGMSQTFFFSEKRDASGCVE